LRNLKGGIVQEKASQRREVSKCIGRGEKSSGKETYNIGVVRGDQAGGGSSSPFILGPGGMEWQHIPQGPASRGSRSEGKMALERTNLKLGLKRPATKEEKSLGKGGVNISINSRKGSRKRAISRGSTGENFNSERKEIKGPRISKGRAYFIITSGKRGICRERYYEARCIPGSTKKPEPFCNIRWGLI